MPAENKEDQDMSDQRASKTRDLPYEGRLIEQGVKLGQSHQVSSRAAQSYPLLDQIAAQKKLLESAYQKISGSSDTELSQSHSTEWFTDNYYLVDEAFQQIEEDFPRAFYQKLPLLKTTELTSQPRVLSIAWKLIEQVGCNPNYDQITQYILAYQGEQKLKIAEVWAIPVMLRFVVLEMLAMIIASITDLNFTPYIEEMKRINHKADQRSAVGNCIQGLRSLRNIIWKEFFTSVNQVEQILVSDPIGTYSQMDFDSCDQYRRAVEDLAELSGIEEGTVATLAINLAQDMFDRSANTEDASIRLQSHVGYYLVREGRASLEKRLSYQPSRQERVRRWGNKHAFPLYIGGILLLVVILIALLVYYLVSVSAQQWQIIAATGLALLPASSIAVRLVNLMVTSFFPPRPPLFRMDYSDNVPETSKTLVVIPALLSSSENVAALLRQLEIFYLGNGAENIFFTLLTDFPDAKQQHLPEDEQILEQVSTGIHELNEKYPHPNMNSFFLFHRNREWNESESSWIGWERKRGKLIQLNQFLLTGKTDAFSLITGQIEALQETRFVITVDEDTLLPNNTARELIGTMSHPFNEPKFDEYGSVTEGYTLLQPRVEIKPVNTKQSWFTQIFAGDGGINLYSQVVSNVYQDLFAEGSFMGKGIYDVAAFMQSVDGQIAENTILSHDLLEGSLGRSGFVSDIVLYEGYPSIYLAYVQRIHRWVRGDWQLLPWLLPIIKGKPEHVRKNPLSPLGYWKIIDNLRRSLIYPTTLLLLISSWFIFPGSPFAWFLIALFPLSVPVFSKMIPDLQLSLRPNTLKSLWQSIRADIFRWVLGIIFLPYQSLLVVDAIIATLVRLTVTREHLLQWTTASHTIKLLRREFKLQTTWMRMRSVAFLTIILALIVGFFFPERLIFIGPILLLWLVSPQIAHWISQPMVRVEKDLSPEQEQELRKLARRTWHFFEQYIGPDDHWLPPDHFQEEPRGTVAHRTSPTNIGLGLLSILAAYDLGYISISELTVRLQNAFNELQSMEKYSGHLLNWYETQTLKPLLPRYVSTVDSGNFAGALLALKHGCLEAIRMPVIRSQHWRGLLDNLSLLRDILLSVQSVNKVKSLIKQVDQIQETVSDASGKPGLWNYKLFSVLEELWVELDQNIRTVIQENAAELDSDVLQEIRVWSERIRQHLVSIQRSIDRLLPWENAFRQSPEALKEKKVDPNTRKAWQILKVLFSDTTNLDEIPEVCNQGIRQIKALQNYVAEDESLCSIEAIKDWCEEFIEDLSEATENAHNLLSMLWSIVDQAEALFRNMDFQFLYNPKRDLFRIGYNVDSGKLDDNHYDLLASEARLASLVAISKSEVPQKHWLYLGRPLTKTDQGHALISWSGSMFEYLMPYLLMQDYPDTLLNLACNTVIDKQINYCDQKDVPWGVSESGYYHFDANMNYQYRAFGIPGLGLKRGLDVDLVISPYATVLALPFRPSAVLENISRLRELGMVGLYGLYEALDYTESRLPLAKDFARVSSFMSHHQGMIMLSIANFLDDSRMVRRFHSDPRIEAFELLLQEQIPSQPKFQVVEEQEITRIQRQSEVLTEESWTPRKDLGFPSVHVLSNGRYSSLVTHAGGGYTQYLPTRARRSDPLMLTRWRPDITLDRWGTWIYIEDLNHGNYWSAAAQPTGVKSDSQDVSFYPHQIEFSRRDNYVSTRMLISVSPEDNLEVRKLSFINHHETKQHLRISSYAEVVLSEQALDVRHPAFNKMFLESEYISELSALIYKRRPSSSDEESHYLVHMLVSNKEHDSQPSYECDRENFIGRGSSVRTPAYMRESNHQLKNTSGTTLDPIVAISQEFEIAPRETCEFAFLTFIADTRRKAIEIAKSFRLWSRIDGVFDQAAQENQNELMRLDLSVDNLATIQQLMSVLYYPHAALRADAETLMTNEMGQSGLWPYAISGDYPVVLVQVRKSDDTPLVRDLLKAHQYWRRRGIKIDLVILDRSDVTYDQDLQGELYQLLTKMKSDRWINQRGGIFIINNGQVTDKDIVLLETVARAIFDGEKGSFAEQVESIRPTAPDLPNMEALEQPISPGQSVEPIEKPEELHFFNGYGGFSEDGEEYVIHLKPDQWTPAPWINVIANPNFGCITSETGLGMTWAGNSGENQLTTWRNDPLLNPPAEAVYLRNEETGQVWSPTPLPTRVPAPYQIRHGAGYTTYNHNSYGLNQSVRIFVDPEDAVKFVTVGLTNNLDSTQQISATYYAEWVLGPNRTSMAPYIQPEYEPNWDALLARNEYNQEFRGRVAFLAASREIHGYTTDRYEFLGKNGSYENPGALKRVGLNRSINPGTDPCAVMQVQLWIEPGETKEVTFLLGQGEDREESIRLIEQYRRPEAIEKSWEENRDTWEGLLNNIVIHTPDRAIDLIFNRWLLYQNLSCRIWGRSALYQSGGAFGFRDQLQDVMAIVHVAPEICREHILRSARHQFEEGDVLHWWHPPSGRGVRTRCSDNMLWLPYVTAHYVELTGDESILWEDIPFLSAEPLGEDEHERYAYYEHGQNEDSLFEHCQRAIQFGTTEGVHGLPLIGSHDWNDGMNRIGVKGEGESVWLGWFLIATLQDFSRVCEQVDKSDCAQQYRTQAEKIRRAIENNAWDGAWYRRAYFDDGTPLGSDQNDECKIDSLAQSWAVISNAGDSERVKEAMGSVEKALVDWNDSLVQLFDPPFDKTHLDPGYIKGYPPGIRENGGQYTHAALWATWAFAALEQGEMASDLFRMLNPVNHSDRKEKADRYQVEPYAVAADIYSVNPHVGKGGWTWYTGSAGWMYQLGLEMILGIKRSGARMKIDPHIPKEWDEYSLHYRYGNTTYQIHVENPSHVSRGVIEVRVDNKILEDGLVNLVDDQKPHRVEIVMGENDDKP